MAARWRVGLLTLAVALVWIAHYDRWTAASWKIPTDYRGDALEILTRIQAAAEGDAVPLQPQVVTRLGAPFGANWSAYPSSDLLLIWLLGRVATIVGVFTAANLAMLAAMISAAVSFYGCARWLRVRWEWAFATALLFAFTFQTFNRGLPHLFFLFSWTVPLALLACGLVAASRRLRCPGPAAAFCVTTALIIGVGNPYNLFLFLQLLCWAVAAQWFGPRRKANLITGALCLVVAVTAFFIVESHVWLFTTDSAASSPLVRNYGGTERYALKPLELLLPPASHRWEGLAFFGHRYVRWSEWRGGEGFAPYLGIVGVTGLGWLGFVALRALLRRTRIPGPALPAIWVVAFASVGGLTNMIAFFTGLIVFRATNRFSIFLSALALLFLARSLARALRTWPRWTSLAGACGIAVFGLADQLPIAPGPGQQARIAHMIDADRELGRLLEGRLPPGAMVFQMPVMAFPEAKPPHQLGDYEYFRPYLATHSLRFSYGTLRDRSRGRWQGDTEALPTAQFVQRLERYGFAALYFSRRSFPDRGEKVLADLAAIGRSRWIEGSMHEQVVVFLQPENNPEKPIARTLTFGVGWQAAVVGEPRWAHGPATLSYFNPSPHPALTTIRLTVSGPDERHLSVSVNGRSRIERRIAPEARTIELKILLRPGYNRIDVATPEPAERTSQERGHLRAFALHESEVVFEPALRLAKNN